MTDECDFFFLLFNLFTEYGYLFLIRKFLYKKGVCSEERSGLCCYLLYQYDKFGFSLVFYYLLIGFSLVYARRRGISFHFVLPC